MGIREYNIGIIGGDLRIVKLAEMLAKDNYIIYTYGFEKANLDNPNILRCKEIEELTKNSNIIISGMPFSKNKEDIFAPFSDEKIIIKDLFTKIQGKTFIAGGIDKSLREKEENIKIIDLLEIEELTVLNAIPTAEGAIQIAMEETEITLHNSNVLILGFGRIGKILAKMLNGIGAKVSCEARKSKDLIWIKTLGYKSIPLNSLDESLDKYDIIFNTIPSLILDANRLKKLNRNCLLIDLASAPGGIDFELAKDIGIKTIWALALPGKVAPITSAKYIKDIIYNIIQK